MTITQEGHYIVRGNTPMGESYHVLYIMSGFDSATHPLIGEIVGGPYQDADIAWREWRTSLHPQHQMYLPPS